MAKMDNVLDKQTKHLERIEGLAKTDRLIQLAQVALEKRLDVDENQHSLKQVQQLENHEKVLKSIDEKLSGKGALAKKVEQLGESIRKSVPTMSKERAEDITEKATKNPYFKTMGDRMAERKEGFKNFFTMRGFLDKTGIVSKGTGGILDTALARREAKQQYVKDRLATDPQLKNLRSDKDNRRILGEQFDKQQSIQGKMTKNEAEIERLRKAGYSDVKIKKTGLLDTQAQLAGEYEKVDPRVRMNKENMGSKKKEKEQDEKAPKIVKKKSSGASESTADKKSEGLGPADLTEADIENQKLQQGQLDLLTKIEENTRPAGKADAAKPKKPEDAKEGGFLDTIMGFLGDGLLKAARFLFNPKMILKAFTKVFAPIMIVGSLVNGLIDGFKAWQETGSITEALIAGLGGILDFLTFGLIDAKTIRAISDWISGFVDEYIIEPISKFVEFVGEAFDEYIKKPLLGAFEKVGDLLNEYVVQPLKEIFQPVVEFFTKLKDQVFGFLENFGIPEIGFTIPLIDKKVSIGPFYPFKKSANAPAAAPNASSVQAKSNAVTPEPAAGNAAKVVPNQSTSANQVATASSEADMAKNKKDAASPIVVAPSTTNVSNNSSSIAMKPLIRHNDPTINRYTASRYAV